MKTRASARHAALAALLLPAAGAAVAAGGHHGVDDATILQAAQCEQENWGSRLRGGGRLLHAGFGCRVGPVELGAAVEHARADDASATAWNLEAKWARAVGDGWFVGIDIQPQWQAHQRPRYAATQFAALATWTPRTDLNVHVNIGRDFVRGDSDLPRHGAALEWSPADRWWLVGERYLEDRTHFARVGVRWSPAKAWTLDLSHASRLRGPQPSRWTLGVTFALGDD